VASLGQLLEKAQKAKQLGKAVVASGFGLVMLWMTEEAKRRIKNRFGAK
jgi:hypothetical protein